MKLTPELIQEYIDWIWQVQSQPQVDIDEVYELMRSGAAYETYNAPNTGRGRLCSALHPDLCHE